MTAGHAESEGSCTQERKPWMHTPRNATKYAVFRWLGSHPDSNSLAASLGMFLPFPFRVPSWVELYYQLFTKIWHD